MFVLKLGYIVDEMIDLFICVRLINYCYFQLCGLQFCLCGLLLKYEVIELIIFNIFIFSYFGLWFCCYGLLLK